MNNNKGSVRSEMFGEIIESYESLKSAVLMNMNTHTHTHVQYCFL